MNIIRRYRSVPISIFMALFIFSMSAHAQITLDGTMGPSGTLDGPDYVITDSMGTEYGANLFHSFGEFNIYSNESATFTGPGYLQNIISRVTGGNPSIIDGLLRSEITGANMYFINPSGMMFGQNAVLDVSGSFHASTADYLELGETGRFDASVPANTVLTSAAPSAFGFLGENPSGITVDGSFLEVPEGEILSMVGGDIEIENGYLYAPGGQINVVSVASEGEVGFEGNAPVVDAFEKLGDINITHSSTERVEIDGNEAGNLDVSGEGGGTIYIRGGGFVLDGGQVAANTLGNKDGGGVDIQLTNDFVGRNAGKVNTDTFGSGNAGNILFEVGNLTLTGGSEITTRVAPGRSGNAGSITITALGSVDISGYYIDGFFLRNSSIRSLTYGRGNAGDIQLNAGNLTLTDAGLILTSAQSGSSGNAGNITITATDSLNISGYYTYTYIPSIWSSSIRSETYGKGDAGNIQLNVNNLTLTDVGIITTSAREGSSGKAGNITITATDSVNISGYYTNGFSLWNSSILSETLGEGDAGSIQLNVSNLTITDVGRITTSARAGSSGNGGNITIIATDSVNISGYYTNVSGLWASSIRSETYGKGDAGSIQLNVGNLTLTDVGGITTSARQSSSGEAGDITITAAGAVSISGYYTSGSSIWVSSITSETWGRGDSGSIQLNVGNLTLTDVGQISTSTREGSSGKAGDITITAAGAVSISGYYTNGSSIWSSAIGSITSGKGDAGSIQLNVGNLTLSDVGQISTTAWEGSSGNAGDITITSTDSVNISGYYTNGSSLWASAIRSNSLDGKEGGDIQIETNYLNLNNNGEISADSKGAGKGGNIKIDAALLEMRGNSSISAKSTGTGNAGDITIGVSDLLYSENSSITTEAEQAAGGNINIYGNDVQLLYNSEITASVASGEGGGGNVTMDVDTLVAFDDSDITARADEGFGGNITINAKAVFFSDDIDLDASSNVSGREGSVQVNSPAIDISGGMIPLPERFLDVEELLPASCEVGTEEKKSSFTIIGRESIPEKPDALLPGT